MQNIALSNLNHSSTDATTGLYVASLADGAGKSLLSMALGLLLKEDGMSLGYMKPLGANLKRVEAGNGDVDALTVQEVLGLNHPPQLLTPLMLPTNWLELSINPVTGSGENARRATALHKVKSAYTELAAGRRLMLVSGTGSFPSSGYACGLDSLALTRELGLKTLIIERFNQGINYDALLYYKELLGQNLIGVVLNAIPPKHLHNVNTVLAPYLEEQGLEVLGIITHEPRLNAIRVLDLSYALAGRIVAGNANAQRRVEGFIIGTMQVENFISRLRDKPNCAAIAGGDRSDLHLAALYGNSPCLILTGNMGPSELVRSKAEAVGVPIIAVKEDSYQVARMVDSILNNTRLQGLEEIRIGVELMRASLNLARIKEKLAL